MQRFRERIILACCPIKPIDADTLLLTDSSSLTPAKNLTPDELREDGQVLIYALKNGYGGRNYIPLKEFNTAVSKIETSIVPL